MSRQNNLTIYGLSYEGVAYCEANGLAKCFASYASNCPNVSIESIGFNANSGYTYIALENGVQIVSSMGQEVEYLTVRSNDGCELWHDSYEDALVSPYVEEGEEDWIDHEDSEDF